MKRSKKTGESGTSKANSSDSQSAEGIVQLAAGPGASESAEPPIYKMQDLMQNIAERADLKRSDLRAAAGLVCAALGIALQDGRTVSLPGLGKITPRKRTVKPEGDILTARIKLPTPVLDRSDALDPEAEDHSTETNDEKA
ncbi:MAG: hypothetical protein COW55_14575 [Rhodobacteraceae bacterium CG17_big_fil_post_rev_8_21_14_2_50_65_11]|nr:MAG: hypothetical protein COW55_14575 [Rhodobacteraceae bacterium CG17_big_fil_post_rev_8_21_14_2_50_65_11]